ncbi:hypothetical protein [Celerinatantimonas yamalensis]|uniref:KfrA N-terminal DNA-binding domain-containing protein n=1 Tax=Celerinatantimonas yamalensis TaxID=559956 RepID=A0ABW9G818_9GAMM
MSDLTLIYQVIQHLHQQGKKPTLALVKARLARSYPLPMLIQALKSYQHVPDAEFPKGTDTPVSNNNKENSLQERIQQLENTQQHLMQRLNQLEAKLHQLNKSDASTCINNN